ncbi:Arachidonate 15-lipoxygenase [Pseudocercospora fuligena]|uniref:Manganese lipoxygenase n=1 Tax=Pseudocercospora fuligena TaxID=685502 RepID=A0A8H6RV75_9PEZI|nr:Arachidonate 15-lipoxygenase [Pseudocercospora fuligena]
MASDRNTVALTPGVIVKATDTSTQSNQQQWPSNLEDFPIPALDTGVFLAELANVNKLPTGPNYTDEERDAAHMNPESLFQKFLDIQISPIAEGTYRGTQLALTKICQQIESSYASFMNTANFEPSIPRPWTIEQKREAFSFTDPMSDGYPPHLNLAGNRAISDMNPGEWQKSTMTRADLFNKMRLAQMTALLPQLIPKKFITTSMVTIAQGQAKVALGDMGRPDQGRTLKDVEDYNRHQRAKTGGFFDRNDIFNLPNMGDIPDWYSDRRFAQQFLTGSNPTTIERASRKWITHFMENATQSAADQRMKSKIQFLLVNDPEALYMQDYSDFREGAGLSLSQDMKYSYTEYYDSGLGEMAKESFRYGVAAVCLFHLQPDGQLQPLAIVCDWRGSAAKSVTIYNKELSLSEQRNDWAWRYAKTCVRHEITAHLVNTHFIEEATIAKVFILTEYKKFDFMGSYAPNDLARRGFPVSKRHETRYRNYAYARCIYSMWFKIRDFVEAMLKVHYGNDLHYADEAVLHDSAIKDWCAIMQAPSAPVGGGADIRTFPTIVNFNMLVDAVTMCIHLASPQHTAVNYLQNYYQSFVPNKPACLYRPVPTTRAELDSYKEQDLVDALPMNHPRDWLLASHIPYLLSSKPGDKESLIIYAASKYHLYKDKPGVGNKAIAEAAAKFYKALADSEEELRKYGDDTWDSSDIHYNVLSPSWNAVSIVV